MKILYAASVISHINNFHLPYIEALRQEGHTVLTMARGAGADIDIPFEKSMTSPKNLSNIRRIRKILKEERFDAVMLNTSLAAFLIRAAMPKKNRPRVLNIVHGYLFYRGGKGMRNRILLFCERVCRKKTDAVLTMNREDELIARESRLCLGKIYTTRGFGVRIKLPTEAREDVRGRLGCTDSYLLAFVGELSGRKNEELLISALPKLSERIPEIKLCLVGSGAEEEKLKNQAKALGVCDRVIFTGQVSDPQNYVAAADLYVSASRIEGLPFNIVEAMGEERTVLASDIKGHVDIIRDGRDGYIFPLGDIDALTEKVVKIHSGELSLNPREISARAMEFSFSEVFSDTLGCMRDFLCDADGKADRKAKRQ